MLSRWCMQRNCFTCHQTEITCGAGVANWQLPTAAGAGGAEKLLLAPSG